MKRLKLYITLLVLLFIPSAAMAFSKSEVKLADPVGGDILPGGKILEAGSIQESVIFSKVIPFAIKYAIRLAVALAVLALILGGYQYLTAYGDDEKHKNAMKTITFALIGLILAITAFAIVTIITNLKIT